MNASDSTSSGDEFVLGSRWTRRQMIRNMLLAGGVMASPSLLAACATGSTPSGAASSSTSTAAVSSPSTGGRLQVAMVGTGGAETINPLFMPGTLEVARAYNLYDRLFIEDPAGSLGPVPNLAESLEGNADATVWQLKLKSGITYHNGKSFGADDVLYTLNYIFDNETQGASFASSIDMSQTKKVSDTEIAIHLSSPIGDLQGLLAGHVYSIIPDGFTDFDNPIGTGPFKFDSLVPQERSLFIRNEDYFGGAPHVDELELIIIDDTVARLNALLGGDVDAIAGVDASSVPQLDGDAATQIMRVSSPSNIPFTMRQDTEPFDEVKVRQAVRLAVDRPLMIDIALGGFGTLGNDLQGLGFPSYNDELPQREYDPERAAALLAEAGIDELKLTLHTKDEPGFESSATALAEMAKPAGISIELELIPPGDFWNSELKYASASAPFYQSSWPYSFEFHAVSGMLPGASSYGETTWLKEGWEEEFRRAQTIPDTDERNRVYKDLQVPIWEEGGYVVWGFQDRLDGLSSKISGAQGHPARALGNYRFKDWQLTS